MTKSKDKQNATNGKPSAHEMLAAIRRKAAVLAKIVDQLAPEQRAEAEKRIRNAYEAIQPKPWQQSILQGVVIDWIESRARHWPANEGWAVDNVVEGIAMAMNDPWAPKECNGRRPSREAVLNCLSAWNRSPGRPKGSTGGQRKRDGQHVSLKHRALFALFKELDIGGANQPTTMKKMLQRRAEEKRRRSMGD